MPSADIKISIGNKAKDYIHIVDKQLKYKRSEVKLSESKGDIKISIKAADPRALLSSMNSAIKQLRIVSSIDGMIDDMKA